MTTQQVAVTERMLDIDAHEMTPTHFWGEIFGPVAGELAELAVPLFKKTGANDFYNPTLAGDLEPIDEHTVWNIRGTRAPSAFDLSRRVEALDTMGIRRQLVFPSYGLVPMHLQAGPGAAIRHAMELGSRSEDEIQDLGRRGLEEYNEWAVRMTGSAPDRLRPVAYLSPSHRTPGELFAEAKDLVDRGIRAVHLNAGTPPGGRSPADPELDELWAYLAERDVAVTTHLGSEADFVATIQWMKAPAFAPGKVESHEIGLEPYSFATLHFSHTNWLVCLILGGVFERHPRLRFGVIEAGASWFGPLAESLDMWATKVYAKRLEPFISMKPSEYMARNVRITPFNNFEDVADMFRRYPQVADCYAFSTDFPHIEGGTDVKRKHLAALDGLGDDVLEKFFATNGELLLPD
ncbi:MAG: amidohydrolase family protein [Acidimicrobiia bacterium]